MLEEKTEKSTASYSFETYNGCLSSKISYAFSSPNIYSLLE